MQLEGNRMHRDYRKDLENAARQMILVHRVDTLTRLILRTIMRNIRVRHAGMFIYNKSRQEYIVTVSKGKKGTKVPAGFTKVSIDNPVIRFFTDNRYSKIHKNDPILLYHRLRNYRRLPIVRNTPEMIATLDDLKESFMLYQAAAFIPGFFRNNLIGILFIGDKENGVPLSKEELSFLSVLGSDVFMAIQNAWLFEDLKSQLDINKHLFLNTVTALAAAIDAKDKYTIGHTERVVEFSLAIARDMTDPEVAQKQFLENLSIAALLHDIGKIGIPESVLNKSGPLNEEDKAFIHRHPQVGAEILAPISEFKEVILGVKYHHEWYDGSGYPYKLRGKDIPLTAAIISVADAYDAMTSERPYRSAMSHEKAVRIIQEYDEKQFNPQVVKAFLSAIGNRSGSMANIYSSLAELGGNHFRVSPCVTE